MDSRPLFAKRDIWLGAGLLLLAVVCYWLFRPSGGAAKTARITLDGRVIAMADLTEDRELTLDELPGIRFTVRDGTIAFTESDCPDRLCIRSGALHRPGQMAVCLPRRVSVTVEGDDGGLDGVAF